MHISSQQSILQYSTYKDTRTCEKNPLPVVDAHTVVDVRTVVVEHFHTPVAHLAVLGAKGLNCATGMTQATQWVVSLLPLIKVGHL